MINTRKKQVENRNLLSSFFVTLLIGLAFQEMIDVVKAGMQGGNLTLDILFLTLTFFFISMRFFVGNQLHLLSDALVHLPGSVWFYDLMIIISQCVVLIFLGSLVSVDINQKTSITFIDFMVVLYMIDITWIISQWALGKVLKTWKRAVIPWAWAILNATLVLLTVILNLVIKDIFTVQGLGWLLILNLVAFVVDVVLVDYYDAI